MPPLDPKPVSASHMTLVQVMTVQDANLYGNVHGGNIMKLADTAAGVVAIRHSGTNCVTAAVDRFDFHAPVFIGNLVTLRASVNYVGRTSMEIGVRVEAEDIVTGRKVHTNSCYFTMVALDRHGAPTEVPGLILSTDDDRRRHENAGRRVRERREARRREP